MTRISLLLLAMCGVVVTACSDEAAPGASGSGGSGVDAQYELKSQLAKFKTDARVYENEKVLEAQKAVSAAQSEWLAARDSHPELKPLADQAKELMEQAGKASGGDMEAAKKLAAEAGEVKGTLEQMAAKTADLRPLWEAREEAQKGVERAEYEAMKAIPEAKPLVEKWEALGE